MADAVLSWDCQLTSADVPFIQASGHSACRYRDSFIRSDKVVEHILLITQQGQRNIGVDCSFMKRTSYSKSRSLIAQHGGNKI